MYFNLVCGHHSAARILFDTGHMLKYQKAQDAHETNYEIMTCNFASLTIICKSSDICVLLIVSFVVNSAGTAGSCLS